jgi:hypothetical protein
MNKYQNMKWLCIKPVTLSLSKCGFIRRLPFDKLRVNWLRLTLKYINLNDVQVF